MDEASEALTRKAAHDCLQDVLLWTRAKNCVNLTT